MGGDISYTTAVKEVVNGLPIQAVLQGAGLISGLVRIDLSDGGRCAVCTIMLGSLTSDPCPCTADQLLFNVLNYQTGKKQIQLQHAEYVPRGGTVQRASWQLQEDVEFAYGRFDYALVCSDEGRPLMPGDLLIVRLCTNPGGLRFGYECFMDAPASTFNGFQAALVIKYPGYRQMLAGGQFEPDF